MIMNKEMRSNFFVSNSALIIEQLGAANWEWTGSIIKIRKRFIFRMNYANLLIQESLACWPAQITVDGIVVTDPNTILRFFDGNYLTVNYP